MHTSHSNKCNYDPEIEQDHDAKILKPFFDKYMPDDNHAYYVDCDNDNNVDNIDCVSSNENKYESCVERYNSFEDWVGDVNPMLLAYAGFFLAKKHTDIAQCFSCGLILDQWNHIHDPIDEHYDIMPNCKFVKSIYLPKNIIKY